MTKTFSEAKSPSEAMEMATLAGQRTLYWGLENKTNEAIEISFGQLTSRYDVPGYTKDTGTKLICQNTAPGASCIRDPIIDTGGVPIAASYYDFTVKIAGSGQQLHGVDEAPPKNYFVQAVYTLVYAPGTADGKTYRLVEVEKKVKEFAK